MVNYSVVGWRCFIRVDELMKSDKCMCPNTRKYDPAITLEKSTCNILIKMYTQYISPSRHSRHPRLGFHYTAPHNTTKSDVHSRVCLDSRIFFTRTSCGVDIGRPLTCAIRLPARLAFFSSQARFLLVPFCIYRRESFVRCCCCCRSFLLSVGRTNRAAPLYSPRLAL